MKKLDCGGGQVVSVIAFYSDDPGSTPAVLSVKFVFEKNENKQTEAGLGPFFKKYYFTALTSRAPSLCGLHVSHFRRARLPAFPHLVRRRRDLRVGQGADHLVAL